MELTSFETMQEFAIFDEFFTRIIAPVNLKLKWVIIDGINLIPTPKSRTDWFWTNSGKQISYPIPWLPGQPDCAGGSEFCLTLGNENADRFLFNDYPCMQLPTQFLCQCVDRSI